MVANCTKALGAALSQVLPTGLAMAMLALASLVGVAPTASQEKPPDEPIAVNLFWSATCPHCARARSYVEQLAARDHNIRLRSLELSQDRGNDRAYVIAAKRYGIDPPVVPLVVIGDTAIAGFASDGSTAAQYHAAIDACRSVPCVDFVATVLSETPAADLEVSNRPHPPDRIRLPLVGDIAVQTLSLPTLTVVLGLVDGFNPCAMWVLLLLIGLLISMKDEVRMWTYGGVFLVTSAAVYLAFMTAWLNVFLLLGAIPMIRAVVGIFAIGLGGYYLWQFWSRPDASCPITTPGERQRVSERLKSAVAQRSFLAAIGGIIVLAAAVNLIELLCSAGIPAVYTQVLAMSNLSSTAHAAYLLLYVAMFLLDDVIVFVTAMLTLRATGLTANYSRYSHLIGAVVLAGVGAALLLAPELLAFSST